jgi:ABC-type transport system involved in multi-copper enzyme maturation permease subunit
VLLLAALGVVLFLALLGGSAGVDMHLSADRLAALSLMTVLLALRFGALALAVSCAVGRRVAIGVAAAAGAAYPSTRSA